MFDKFGEFNSYEELNLAAEGFKKEGDKESLMELAEENGIDMEDAREYMDGTIPEFATQFSAALGRLEVMKAEKIEKNKNKMERMALGEIYRMAKSMCTEEVFAKSVMKKGKRIERIYVFMRSGAEKHKEGNEGMSAGTDQELRNIIRAYFQESDKKCKTVIEALYDK